MRGKLIVAGGGIGGLTATLALHRAGIDVMLYERAPVFADIGAGMSVWPNATRVFTSVSAIRGQLMAARSAWSRSSTVISPDSVMGNPHGSRRMHSGSSSAHAPW